MMYKAAFVLKRAWAWLKVHWQIPFLLVWSVLIWILSRRNTEAMSEVMKSKKESYEKQVKVLRESHNSEILERENLIKEYQESLRKTETTFKEKERKLSEAQKDEIKEIVIKSKGNPDEIRKRIEKEFGFKFVE